MVKSCLSGVILFAFMTSFCLGPLPPASADEFHLPVPGVMVHLSPPLDPPVLKGIKVYPDNPFRFEFILDRGDSFPLEGKESEEKLKEESTKLIKYFLASLTIPEKNLWVNLSPYEKDRIIPSSFGQTEMGRDLLAEDYVLKQITASLIYPEDETGKRFWKRVYEEAARRYGTTNIPVNTFNKVWIVPQKAVIYENANEGTAYVVESKLKVMLDQDYLALAKNNVITSESIGSKVDVSTLGSKVIREIVIPELTREVNEGKNFVRLRQVYNSLILAAWYKRKIKDSILSQIYADQNKTVGVRYTSTVIPSKSGIRYKNDVDGLYLEYLKAFKKGVYNYIKEDTDPMTQESIPRKYFSGGVDFVFGRSFDRTNMNASPSLQIINKPTAAMVSVFRKTFGLLIVAATLMVGNYKVSARNPSNPTVQASGTNTMISAIDQTNQVREAGINALKSVGVTINGNEDLKELGKKSLPVIIPYFNRFPNNRAEFLGYDLQYSTISGYLANPTNQTSLLSNMTPQLASAMFNIVDLSKKYSNQQTEAFLQYQFKDGLTNTTVLSGLVQKLEKDNDFHFPSDVSDPLAIFKYIGPFAKGYMDLDIDETNRVMRTTITKEGADEKGPTITFTPGSVYRAPSGISIIAGGIVTGLLALVSAINTKLMFREMKENKELKAETAVSLSPPEKLVWDTSEDLLGRSKDVTADHLKSMADAILNFPDKKEARLKWLSDALGTSLDVDQYIRSLKSSRSKDTANINEYNSLIEQLQGLKEAFDSVFQPLDNARIDEHLLFKKRKISSEIMQEKAAELERTGVIGSAKKLADRTLAPERDFYQQAHGLYQKIEEEIGRDKTTEKSGYGLRIVLDGLSIGDSTNHYWEKFNNYDSHYRQMRKEADKLADIAFIHGGSYVRIYNDLIHPGLLNEDELLNSTRAQLLDKDQYNTLPKLFTMGVINAVKGFYNMFDLTFASSARKRPVINTPAANVNTIPQDSAMNSINRRDFIKGTTLAALAAASTGLFSAFDIQAQPVLIKFEAPLVTPTYHEWMQPVLAQATKLKASYTSEMNREQRGKQHAGEVSPREHEIERILSALDKIIEIAGLKDTTEIGSPELGSVSASSGRGLYTLMNARNHLLEIDQREFKEMGDSIDGLLGLRFVNKPDLKKNFVIIFAPAAGDFRWRAEHLIKGYEDKGFNVLGFAYDPLLSADQIADQFYQAMSQPFMKEVLQSKGVAITGFSAARTYVDQTLFKYGKTGLFKNSFINMDSGNWGGSPRADVTRYLLPPFIKNFFPKYKNMIDALNPKGRIQLTQFSNYDQIVGAVARYNGFLANDDKHMPNFDQLVPLGSSKIRGTDLLSEVFNGDVYALDILKNYYANSPLHLHFLQEVSKIEMSFGSIDIKSHKGDPYYQTVHIAAKLSPEGADRDVRLTDDFFKSRQGLDQAMRGNTGGIDLTASNLNLQLQNAGVEIKFHLDPAMLAQLRNAPGFTPVVIKIQPLESLQKFLGIPETDGSSV